MRSWHVLAALVLLILGSTPAYSECSVVPARLFSSEAGTAYLRLDGTARLYLLRPGGDRLVWTAKLVNVPASVWVDSGGRWVVTRGNYCNSPSVQDHALTVYDASGTLIADWKLDELVPDLRKHVTAFEVHTPWTSTAHLRFEAPFNELRVFFPWGESKVINRPPGR
jgi:hypothetical protein